MTNKYQWPDGTPRSQGNAFDWRAGKTNFLAELHHAKVGSINSTKNSIAGKTKMPTIKKAKK
jgi:hypothetical protein